MLKIGIDMDGVLANFIHSAIRRLYEITEVEFSLSDFYDGRTIDIVNKKLNSLNKPIYQNRDLYSELCPPGFFLNLEPYGDIQSTFRKLSNIAELYIITTPLEWNFCPQEKILWLKKYLPNEKYQVIFTERPEVKKLINVDFLIDDDPRALNAKNISLIDSASIGLLVERPWNTNLRKFFHTIDSFPSCLDSILDLR